MKAMRHIEVRVVRSRSSDSNHVILKMKVALIIKTSSPKSNKIWIQVQKEPIRIVAKTLQIQSFPKLIRISVEIM